jgi:geranylgeranyl reductase family protein
MADHDVVVVGGGPAGASCAYWLAEAGHDVLLLEKKRYPREKTCGDGLTPRSVRQLHDMGLADELAEHHRFDGLRSIAFGRTLELEWPTHPDYPSYGYVVTRKDLDHLVAERAVKAGATLWQDAEATAPLLTDGLVRGATVKIKDNGSTVMQHVPARYVVVADGGNSRFGRALGTSRERSYPLGMAIRGYFESPRHDEPWIESHLDIRDKAGNVLPGYGWIFPVGDGRVNVGIGLLSTFNQWKAVNTSQLMESFVDYAPASWGISPETSCGPPTGGKLPMALSVGPHAGPTWLVAGDAGGSINPFNGEGIAYAYETGRMAASAVDTALRTGDGLALQDYERRLRTEYALYFKVARAFVRIIGRPELMRALVSTGMRSRTLMEWVLRIMSNMLRPDELGPAEAVYKAVAAIARMAPEA